MDPVLLIGLGSIFGALLLATGTLAASAAGRGGAQRTAVALQSIRELSADVLPQTTAPFADRVMAPARDRLIALVRRVSPAGVGQNLQARLDKAGNPGGWNVERVLAFKGAGLVGLGALGVLLGLRSGGGAVLVFPAALAAFGLYLPDILLYNAGTKRQAQMKKALPDAMDLMTISVEAGLAFDAAISQVARNTEGPLAAEFFRVLQEMQIGKSRSDCFRAMGQRNDVPELRGFTASVVQAEALGIPIADVLRTQAQQMRIKRQQAAEEQAQKVAVKILFPLVFFILPALFVIIIGPGALSMTKIFGN